MNETANHAGYFTGYCFSVEEGNMNKKPTKKKKRNDVSLSEDEDFPMSTKRRKRLIKIFEDSH